MADKSQSFRVLVQWTTSDTLNHFLANCKVASPPGRQRGTIPVDTHDNPDDFEALIPEAIQKTGELKVSCIADYLDTSQFASLKSLRGLMDSGETVAWKIHFPGISPPRGLAFDAFAISEQIGDFNTSDPGMVDWTFKVSGAITIGAFA